VLFYNKNAFRKAKLDPEQPPKTWFEMQGMLDKLQDAGLRLPVPRPRAGLGACR
jgi:sn-glycerol 3-phosphate transport system substrate-binding protein